MLTLFFLRDVVFHGGVYYQRDVHLQWYGQVESFVRSVTTGAWPLWDPYVSFGRPMLANANSQVLYPLTWLNLVIKPWNFYSFYFAFHLLLACTGLFALARRLRLPPGAAFVAAATWLVSGPLLSLGNLWNHLAATTWLPWTLWAADVALTSGRLRAAVPWGIAMALQILAGSPDIFVMTSLVALAEATRRILRAQPSVSRGRLATVTALAFVLALGLAAGQLLPSLELALRSERWALSAPMRTYWSLPPGALLQMIWPVFPADATLPASLRQLLFGSREPLLLSIHVGLALVALAAGAGAAGRWPHRGALLATSLLAILFALGPLTPVYRLAALLPPLQALRFPSKAMVLAGFCLALLAGRGFQCWSHRAQQDNSRAWQLLVTTPLLGCAVLSAWLALAAARGGATWAKLLTPLTGELVAVATLAVVLAVASSTTRRSAAGARRSAVVVALLAIVMPALVHRNLNPTAPRELYTFRPPVLDWLDQADRRRLHVVDYLADHGLSDRHLGRAQPYLVPPRGGQALPLWAGAAALRAYPVPPVGAAWRLFDSFSRDMLGVQPRILARLHAMLVHAAGTPRYTRLLRAAAVSQVVSLHTSGLDDLQLEASPPGPFFEPLRVFRVPAPLPRAYAVDGVRAAQDQEAFDILAGPDFDAAREVILPESASKRATSGFLGSVSIQAFLADRVRLRARLSAPGYVIVVDAYDPGWRASVDEQPVALQRANLAFRAVPVPAGQHTVELVYRPFSVVAGLAVSAATLLLMAATLVLFLVRWARSGKRAPPA